jgi:uncharacterized protein
MDIFADTRFAMNYSPQAAALLARGAMDVDLYKCPFVPEIIQQARAQRPCYVHFSFRAGNRPFEGADWTAIRQAVETTDTPHVNMHLAPSVARFPGMNVGTDAADDTARLIEAMERDVAELAQHFSPEFIALENVMWDPMPPWEIPAPVLRPEVIAKVVRDTGCRFLLDLAHVACTVRYFGADVESYIAALPLNQLAELHVSGTRLGSDGRWHDHHSMGEHDWPLLKWALERIRSDDWPRPRLITFEYGGAGAGWDHLAEESALAADVQRLRDFVSRASP